MTTELKALRIQVHPAEPGEQHAGKDVAARFTCTTPDGSCTLDGVVTRGPRGLAISSLTADCADPAGLTARQMRVIPVGEILAQIRVSEAVAATRRAGDIPTAQSGVCACGCHQQRRGGRTPMRPEHLRALALAYLEETEPGRGPRSVARVAERFGRPEQTIRTWIGRARADGWLGPGQKGRSGCEPGPRLIAEQQITREG